MPKHLWVPETHLYRNVEVSAMRFPRKPFVIFYDTQITYADFQRETECVAGYLQQQLGVNKGDRVLLYMQNSPQFMIAFYAILRADAVVVPVNPMNLTQELSHYVRDSGATVAFAAQDIAPRMQPLLGQGLQHIVVATYSDYLREPTDIAVPEFVAAPRAPLTHAGSRRMGRRAGCRAGAARHRRRPRRPRGDALHLGHHRPPQGLHAHASQRDVQRRRRAGPAPTRAASGSRCCRCST